MQDTVTEINTDNGAQHNNGLFGVNGVHPVTKTHEQVKKNPTTTTDS